MNAKTNTAAAIATVIGNALVIDKLHCANDSAMTADHFAREAAKAAHAADFLDTRKATDRLAAILDLYKGELTHPTVKASFSAALTVLVLAEPVKLAVGEMSEKYSQKLDAVGNPVKGETKTTLKLDRMDALVKGEVPEAGKKVIELTPMQAVDQLQSNALKTVATAKRQDAGIGGNPGAGRKASDKPAAGVRAPFMDELVAVMKDTALCKSMFSVMLIASKQQPHIVGYCAEVCKANGYNVTKKEAAAKK